MDFCAAFVGFAGGVETLAFGFEGGSWRACFDDAATLLAGIEDFNAEDPCFFGAGTSFRRGRLSFSGAFAFTAFATGSGRLGFAFAAVFGAVGFFAGGLGFPAPAETFFTIAAFRAPEADLAEVFAPDFVFDVAICRTPSRDAKVI